MNAKECPDGWWLFTPELVQDTDKYGFVVKHAAYWGLPIPGFAIDPMPAHTVPENPDKVPRSLRVTSVSVEKGKGGWTGGDLSFLATRTPPLFHAFHHKTDQGEDEQTENGGHGGGHGSGMRVALPAQGAELRLGIAERVLECGVGGDRIALGVGHMDAEQGVLEHRTKARFALDQRDLGAQLLGDVGQDGGHAGDPAGLVMLR